MTTSFDSLCQHQDRRYAAASECYGWESPDVVVPPGIEGEKMTLDDYQAEARRTALYPERYRVTYPALGLASEAGEVAGKVKKVLRDRGGDFSDEQIAAIKDELGDVLWYVAVLASDLDLSLDDIAANNVEKLRSRMARGTIQGDGDHR